MEVAQALYKKSTPMAIIPGGTANVLAKDLDIPITTVDAIKLLTKKKMIIRTVDMGIMNNTPFFIRVNFGILADMIKKTDRQLKDKLGQVAYGVTAAKEWLDHKPVVYEMVLDGKKITTEGAALVIANSGNVGISDVSFVPNMSMSDGLLDVILIRKMDAVSVAKAVGNTLLKNKPEDTRQHWQIKKAQIIVHPKQSILRDDAVVNDKEINIRVVPKAINILVTK
jgi:diacylglycerol kinase (ATP)